MPEAIQRSWTLDSLTAAGAPMPSETLAFANARAFIRSVTIDNGGNGIVGVFLNRDPVGTPDFLVAASTYKTLPVLAQRVGISIQSPKGAAPSGTVYAHLTDEALAAASGVSAAANATAVWDQSTFDSGAQMGT